MKVNFTYCGYFPPFGGFCQGRTLKIGAKQPKTHQKRAKLTILTRGRVL
ncbi:MAG: hypothetical protein LBB89_06730 [Treponema sp.]|jgi:hypothetical protein|nr:hypothetical protein [Treponema sp.]